MNKGYKLSTCGKIYYKLANTEICQYLHKYRGYAFTKGIVENAIDNYGITHIGVVVDVKQISAKCTMHMHDIDIEENKLGIWTLPIKLYLDKRVLYENRDNKTKLGDGMQYVIPNFFNIATKT